MLLPYPVVPETTLAAGTTADFARSAWPGAIPAAEFISPIEHPAAEPTGLAEPTAATIFFDDDDDLEGRIPSLSMSWRGFFGFPDVIRIAE